MVLKKAPRHKPMKAKFGRATGEKLTGRANALTRGRGKKIGLKRQMATSASNTPVSAAKPTSAFGALPPTKFPASAATPPSAPFRALPPSRPSATSSSVRPTAGLGSASRKPRPTVRRGPAALG